MVNQMFINMPTNVTLLCNKNTKLNKKMLNFHNGRILLCY